MEKLQTGQRVALIDLDGRLGVVVEVLDAQRVVVRLASGELHVTEASRCLPTGTLGDWLTTAEDTLPLRRRTNPASRKRRRDWARVARTILLWTLTLGVLILVGLVVLGAGRRG